MHSWRTTIRRSEICQGRVDNLLRLPSGHDRSHFYKGSTRHRLAATLTRGVSPTLARRVLVCGKTERSEKERGTEWGGEGEGGGSNDNGKLNESNVLEMLLLISKTGARETPFLLSPLERV